MRHIHENFLRTHGFVPLKSCDKFPEIGITYHHSNEHMNQLYWVYEMDHFIINIHDFYIKKDTFFRFPKNICSGSHTSISMIKTASMEMFHPYQNITNNTVLVSYERDKDLVCLLHGGTPFFSVGIEYKDKYLDEIFSKEMNISIDVTLNAIKALNGTANFTPLEVIADEILSYREISPASKFFYELKARELLSFALERYYKSTCKNANQDDEESLATVAKYIDDHYMANLELDTLAKIATMSKSKLKDIFKKKYGMTITEYTQRRRISMAEHLMLSTDLTIGNVAMSVGYRSHSRFSKLFKRYKGFYPIEFKKMMKNKSKSEIY
ncbi:MAG: AraC family transcriptional regulator [Tissierellia bacterium]|nr:AraC family transcriptional regulator [Tissierellia bacterium]